MVEEQARGPGDNGTPLTHAKREHVYGYLEEIDLIVQETHVWTPLALLLAICLLSHSWRNLCPRRVFRRVGARLC